MSDAETVRMTRVLAASARVAARPLARAERAQKDAALRSIAARLRAGREPLLEANRSDVARLLETYTLPAI